MKKKIVVMLITALLFTVLVNPASLANQNNLGEGSIEINEEEKLSEILRLPFGNGENEIGMVWGGNETHSQGPTSFFVRNNNIYILDNVNKKVVIQSNNTVTEFPIEGLGWGIDLYVTENKTIFVLDTVNRNIRKYDIKGTLLEELAVPEALEIPTALSMDYKKNLIVRQGGDFAFIVDGKKPVVGRYFENQSAVAIPRIVNDKTGNLKIKDKDSMIDIPVNYEHSFGELIVHGFVGNQVVFEKTEVAPDTYDIMAETFIEVMDKQGRFQGAAKVPLADMVFVPDHIVRVSNNKIYLLSVEEDGLKVYEVKVGKKYAKTLQNRIDNYKPENLNLGTGKEPSFGTFSFSGESENGYVLRSTADYRARAMVNYSWTVKSGNQQQLSGTVLPTYVKNASVGASLTGIPYKWGGADGHDKGAGGRSSFGYYQSNSKQTGDVDSNGYGLSDVTGLDCSGFVGLAWWRTDKKYATSTLSEISMNITKSQLKLMDALNASSWHVVLYVSQTTENVTTREATTDGGEKAQTYLRSWKWLDGQNSNSKVYQPIRYYNIVDDGGPYPM